MARIDRIKEELGWLKVVFTVSTALNASLIAWLSHNYLTAGVRFASAGLLIAIVLGGITVGAAISVYRLLGELEDT